MKESRYLPILEANNMNDVENHINTLYVLLMSDRVYLFLLLEPKRDVLNGGFGLHCATPTDALGPLATGQSSQNIAWFEPGGPTLLIPLAFRSSFKCAATSRATEVTFR